MSANAEPITESFPPSAFTVTATPPPLVKLVEVTDPRSTLLSPKSPFTTIDWTEAGVTVPKLAGTPSMLTWTTPPAPPDEVTTTSCPPIRFTVSVPELNMTADEGVIAC